MKPLLLISLLASKTLPRKKWKKITCWQYRNSIRDFKPVLVLSCFTLFILYLWNSVELWHLRYLIETANSICTLVSFHCLINYRQWSSSVLVVCFNWVQFTHFIHFYVKCQTCSTIRIQLTKTDVWSCSFPSSYYQFSLLLHINL